MGISLMLVMALDDGIENRLKLFILYSAQRRWCWNWGRKEKLVFVYRQKFPLSH